MKKENVDKNISHIIDFFELVQSDVEKQDSEKQVFKFNSLDEERKSFAIIRSEGSKINFSLSNLVDGNDVRIRMEYDKDSDNFEFSCTYYSYVPSDEDMYPVPSKVILGEGFGDEVVLSVYEKEELVDFYRDCGISYLAYAPPLFFQKRMVDSEIMPSSIKSVPAESFVDELTSVFVQSKKKN